MSQPPQILYEVKAAAESIYHRQRRSGENSSEARMLVGAVTTALGIMMLLGEFEKRNGRPLAQGWSR